MRPSSAPTSAASPGASSRMPMRMAAGNYVVVSRATDPAGNVQPEQRFENAHGYSHNGWKDPAVMLSVV